MEGGGKWEGGKEGGEEGGKLSNVHFARTAFARQYRATKQDVTQEMEIN